jgi:site-specific DNA-methyltransferase (adenine-specific)
MSKDNDPRTARGSGHASGRWPANLIHDGSDDTTAPMRSAARFFYCAKASKREREQGCDGMPLGPPPASARSTPADGRTAALGAPRGNHHPTVKPIALMEYLCKLASAPGAVVLDPFMGSGTTGIACRNLNREFIGIERDADYFEIAKNRIEHTPKQMEIPA